MSRGQIWLVDLDPATGSEANKVRPALIVGRALLASRALETQQGVVSVVPLTRNVERVFDFQVYIAAAESGLKHDSKAQVEHLRAVSVRRLVRQVGAVSEEISAHIDRAIRLYLHL